MELAVITAAGKVQLPSEIIRRFSPKEKFAVAIDGNVILLNAIQRSKLSSIAERKEGEPMSMEEIVKEVHLYRQERKLKE